jgi:cytochrome c-type biogenesis protein CcmH
VLDAAGSALLARAETLRRARDYAGAIAIYARLAKHAQLSAQAYADYADAVASRNGGSLAGEPARLIEEALRRDPRQPKALWLRASLAHEQHREADALADWRLLATVLPADSPDQRIIAANIVEAQRLAGLGSNGDAPATAALAAPATSVMAASPTPAMSAPAVARISGVVDLASPLAASAPSDATLYIYAKSPGAPGPPLAVLRVRAAHWPVSFSLDDRNAMIPGRTLSGAERVQLEARISLSGNALPQAGDLVGSVADVDPRAGRAVHIAIDHRIS